RSKRDWSSDVCSSDLPPFLIVGIATPAHEAAKGRLGVVGRPRGRPDRGRPQLWFLSRAAICSRRHIAAEPSGFHFHYSSVTWTGSEERRVGNGRQSRG